MEMEFWLYATWLAKFFLYLGISFTVGGVFCYFLLGRYIELKSTILKYIACGAGLALIASTINFFLLVGSFAGTDLGGMFDYDFISLLVSTPIGEAHLLRIVSLIALFVLVVIRLKAWSQHILKVDIILFAVLLLPIFFSFSQLGHVTRLNLIAQILLSIHVLAVSLWMGSLYPLWKTTQIVNGFALKDTMHLFGQIASGVVGVLIVCGVIVALLLIPSLDTLLSTTYGYGFILKLVFVMGIFLLAALNKWYLTPRLIQPAFAKKLGTAIQVEMCVGGLILLTTSYITTVIGLS